LKLIVDAKKGSLPKGSFPFSFWRKTEGLNMKFERSSILHVVFGLILTSCAVVPASAQSYKTEKVTLAAPQELSAAVRDTLSGDALRVTGPNGVLCEVWIRKTIPTAATPT
jgi:hypothetical protein